MSRLIGLYPEPWRRRYGDELAALLAERPPAFGDRLDIVRGALDARLHPQLSGPSRTPDRRGWAPIVGLLLLVVAVVLMANGPVHHDDYGEYRDGAAALPFAVAAMILLAIGLYATIVRLPIDDRVSPVAGVIAIVAGTFWSAMPWLFPIGAVFLVGVMILAVGARRARLWSLPAVLAVVVAAGLPVGFMVAQAFLPWYALRVSGVNPLVFLGSLGLVWLVVGAVTLRGWEAPAAAT